MPQHGRDHKNILRFATALLLIAWWSFFPTHAYACTAPPGGLPHFSVTDHVLASDVVIEGIVLKTEGEWYPGIATIQVYQYIKGSGEAIIAVQGYSPSSMCGTDVREDMHAIFYIRTDEFGSYYAMQLSQFDAIAEPSPENIAEAIAASGQESIVITQPTADAYMTILASITPGTSTPSSTLPPAEPISPTIPPPTVAPDTPILTMPVIVATETPSPMITNTPSPVPPTTTPTPIPELQKDLIGTRCAWIIPTIGVGIIALAVSRRHPLL